MELVLKEKVLLKDLATGLKKAYPKDWQKIELTPQLEAMGIRKLKFLIGETVYLITDPDQFERVVTGIIVRPGSNLYLVAHVMDTSAHYDFELSQEKNIVKALNIEEKKK